MRHTNNIFFIIVFAANTIIAQNLFIEKHFVKTGKILFRLSPETKAAWDLLKTNSIKITRYEINNGSATNPVIIDSNFRAFGIVDTLNWMRYFRKDKNTAAFLYSGLYGKSNKNKQPSENVKQEKAALDLLRLFCDFNVDAAKACGLFFCDSSAAKSKLYLYKLERYITPVTFREIFSFRVDANILDSNKAISDLSLKKNRQFYYLKWNALNYIDHYSGYWVERSEDGFNFVKTESNPVIFLYDNEKTGEIVYKDQVRKTNKKVTYRIRGINFFGETSSPSNTISVFDCAHPEVFIDTCVVRKNGVLVKWSVSDKPALKKSILLRAKSENGTYDKLFESSADLQFTDYAFKQSNYYKIAAIDLNNDTSYSFTRSIFIPDSTPPSSPQILTAQCGKDGQIILKWKSIKENDLQGYNVFRSNRITGEFIQVNKKFITDTFYVDKYTMRSLTKEVFYCAAATDKNFNTSIRSTVVKVKLHDTIPPSTPILRALSPKNTGIAIDFILNKDADVSKYVFFRSDADQKNEEEIGVLDQKDTLRNLIDTSARAGQIYIYWIKALDEGGNFSLSEKQMIKYETGFRKKIGKMEAVVDRREKNIELKWNYSEGEVDKYVLYRSRENEPLTIVKTLNGAQLSWTDKTVNIGNVYEYRIKAVMKNGAESIISEALKIVY